MKRRTSTSMNLIVRDGLCKLELKAKNVKVRNSTVFRFEFLVFKELNYDKETDFQA